MRIRQGLERERRREIDMGEEAKLGCVGGWLTGTAARVVDAIGVFLGDE